MLRDESAVQRSPQHRPAPDGSPLAESAITPVAVPATGLVTSQFLRAIRDGAAVAASRQHARSPVCGRGHRRRRDSRLGRSRRLARTAGHDDGRAAGCDGAREPRPRADGDSQLGFPFPGRSHHRQPRAGRRAQGRRRVRSADRAGHPRRGRACCRIAKQRASRSSAACRSTAASRRCAGCCRLPSRPGARRARCCFPRPTSPKPASSTGCGCFPVASLFDAAQCCSCRDSPPPATPPAPPPSRDRRPRSTTWPTCAASRPGGARSRSPPPARITCCSADRRAPARRCWRGGCRGLLPPLSTSTRRWRSRRFTRSPAAAAGGGLIRTPAVSRAAPHVLGRRARRRRQRAAARRAQPRALRRAVPRRAAGVQPARARDAAPAARAGRGAHRARRAGGARFPAQVMLVGAMNPVPLRLPRAARSARAAARRRRSSRYRRRLSGPLRDRFDLGLELPAVPWSDMRGARGRGRRAVVRARVIAARGRQFERQGCLNGRLEGRALQRHCALGEQRGRSPARPGRRAAETQSARAVTPRTTAWRARSPTWRANSRPGRRTWQRPCTSGCRIASLRPIMLARSGLLCYGFEVQPHFWLAP